MKYWTLLFLFTSLLGFSQDAELASKTENSDGIFTRWPNQTPDHKADKIFRSSEAECVQTKVLLNHKITLQSKTIKQLTKVKHAKKAPKIDGIANEKIWMSADWHPINQLWLGDPYSAEDFQGRFKLTWTEDALYLLTEIKDDILLDKEADPLVAWWDDDCLEIFIDEDNSGGEHQFNHNAFAYHIALDGNVVDMSPEKKGKLYNSHIESKRITTGNTSIWEVKISLYKDTYKDDSENTPVTLKTNKNIGFALAYCDNDTSDIRENFIGSIYVEGDDKNRGYIDASIFGTLLLQD